MVTIAHMCECGIKGGYDEVFNMVFAKLCPTVTGHWPSRAARLAARDNTGHTPLYAACQTGDLNTVLTLMMYNPKLIYRYDMI